MIAPSTFITEIVMMSVTLFRILSFFVCGEQSIDAQCCKIRKMRQEFAKVMGRYAANVL